MAAVTSSSFCVGRVLFSDGLFCASADGFHVHVIIDQCIASHDRLEFVFDGEVRVNCEVQLSVKGERQGRVSGTE